MTLANRRTLLLTGFGPFPGVPLNASSDIALKAAERLNSVSSEITVQLLILPAVWESAPGIVAAAIEEHQPAVALHLGVARRSRKFSLETRARNYAVCHPDADDQLPRQCELIPGGPREIDNTRIARMLQNQLAAAGLKVGCSGQASSYLCNAVYYRSLLHAQPATSMFLHLPADIGWTTQRPTAADAVSATLILAHAMMATERP